MHDEPAASREPRQRWRLVLARAPDAPPLSQRETTEAWEAAVRAAGLPLARSEGATPKARISFGAPLPTGMPAHGELIDVVLTERWPVWQVREALAPHVPAGWWMVDLQDVWLAGPPLAGRVAAADYRIVVTAGPDAPAPDALARGCAALLASPRLERERAKGGESVRYDLRPLVLDVRVEEAGPPTVIVARTRFHPELGTGRPEEVIAALGDAIGAPVAVDAIVRERLILADDLG